MLLFLIALDHYTCGHDKLIKRLQNVKPKLMKGVGEPRLKSSFRTPINIVYNYYFIDNPSKDKYNCKNVGDVITIEGRSVTCTQGDIITDAKKRALKETLANVKLWYHNTLNLTKYQASSKQDLQVLESIVPLEYPQPPVESNRRCRSLSHRLPAS